MCWGEKEGVWGGTQLEFIMAAVLCTTLGLLCAESHGRRFCGKEIGVLSSLKIQWLGLTIVVLTEYR